MFGCQFYLESTHIPEEKEECRINQFKRDRAAALERTGAHKSTEEARNKVDEIRLDHVLEILATLHSWGRSFFRQSRLRAHARALVHHYAAALPYFHG